MTGYGNRADIKILSIILLTGASKCSLFCFPILFPEFNVNWFIVHVFRSYAGLRLFTKRIKFNIKQNYISTNFQKMDREEIKNRVKKVTSRVLEIDESEISDSSNFSFDLGASSMQSVLLVAAFEEEFNIELDEEKSLEVQTIDEATDFISTYLT